MGKPARRSIMKRTNRVVWSLGTVVLAVAITAGPAAATTGYDWLNKSDEPSAVSQPPQSGTADYRSLNSIVGGAESSAVSQPSQSGTAAYRSLNSIVGSEPVPEQTVSVVHEGSGFGWGDAFIGAGAAFVLMLISAMAVYELRRNRRVTVASRA
jgi:hypothetical protein